MVYGAVTLLMCQSWGLAVPPDSQHFMGFGDMADGDAVELQTWVDFRTEHGTRRGLILCCLRVLDVW